MNRQIFNAENAPYEVVKAAGIAKRPVGNNGGKNKRRIKNLVCAFDIETTGLDAIEQSIMYIWQFQLDEFGTVIGRTWDEYEYFMHNLILTLAEDETLVIYVHNLSYEFQFLRGVYDFQPDEVFCMDSRKVLRATMFDEKLEYRCSYIHSNMSLAQFTKKMGVKDAKLSGEEFNYNKKRYPWTEMSEREILYCINDVRGLVEALKIEMAADGDTLTSIPLTSTGYVRRDAKRAMKKAPHNLVSGIVPDYETYVMLREAFRGGNTHANRYYANRIIKDVSSVDRSSSYPDVQVNCEFPMSKFFVAGDITIERVADLVTVKGKAVLMRLALSNVRLRNPYWGCPYLSKDKCRNIKNGYYDNGRILSCDYCETTITDVDFRIIMDEYDFDGIRPFDVRYARYGKLPKPLTDETINYYRAKTELKNVPGQEVYYMKSKNKLNSIYGMSAQNPVKHTIRFIDNSYKEDDTPDEELLEAANKKAFMAYQWGVWVTAWARYRLEEGIKLAGDNFVYCDTDCVKYVGSINWDKYNKKRITDSRKNGAFATDPQGETHYMGVYEQEKTDELFKTMGAKKYCFVQDGKTYITVAGVNKSKGGAELDKYKGIYSFNDGFIFSDAGGLESVYNDNSYGKYAVDGREISITPNVYLCPSTYTLGETQEYKMLIASLFSEKNACITSEDVL